MWTLFEPVHVVTYFSAEARPWARLGTAATEELAGLLAPLARACAAELPFPNPVGVPAPVAGAQRA
jgi:hypothetical protein